MPFSLNPFRLFTRLSQTQATTKEELFVFDGPMYDKTPKLMKDNMDKVRTKEGWASVGLSIRRDKSGNIKPITRKDLWFGFRSISRRDEEDFAKIQTAFKSGKRVTKRPSQIATCVSLGISREEFVYMDEAIGHYLDSISDKENGKYSEAIDRIRKAIELRPNEFDFLSHLCDLYYLAHSFDKLKEIVNFHVETFGGISSMIHSGTAEKWAKLLYKNKLYQEIINFHQELVKGIEEEIRRAEKKSAQNSNLDSPIQTAIYVNGIKQDAETLDRQTRENKVSFARDRLLRFESNCNKVLFESRKKLTAQSRG